MIDCWTVARKELIEVLELWRTARIRLVILLGVFGVYFPASMGPRWVESATGLLWIVWLPLTSSLSLTGDAIAGERERHTLETLLASRLSERAILLGKLLAMVVYGMAFLVLFAVVGLVTVNVTAEQEGLVLFPLPILAGLVLPGCLALALLALVGIIISSRCATARQANQMTAVVIVGIAAFAGALAWAAQFLPANWLGRIAKMAAGLDGLGAVFLATAALALIDGVLLAVALRLFRREPLMLVGR